MKPIGIFNLLVTYIVVQLIWWGYLLAQLSPGKISMVVGEFSVFILLFSFGVYRLRKALKDEASVHRLQKNFLLSVTHELKSPLASVKLYLQTILKRDLEPAKKEVFLKNALSDIDRLDDLVEKMLMATKFESKSYSFPKEVFNLSELVSSIAARRESLWREKFNVESDIASGIKLNGDRFAISSAVENLLENAYKYAPQRSEITIKLAEREDGIHLTVADQGPGIAEGEKSKIFQKFYRSCNEEVREKQGTGLGLFIVKQVADNHGAVIQISNNFPIGSIFELVF